MWWLATESKYQTRILNTLVSTGEVNTQTHAAAHNYEPIQGKREKKWTRIKSKRRKKAARNFSWASLHTICAFNGWTRQMYGSGFNFFPSSLYALSASAGLPARLSVSLSVSLFKHLANIISIYCSHIVMYEFATMLTEGLTLCARVWESNWVTRCVMSVCACMRACGCVCVGPLVLMYEAAESMLFLCLRVAFMLFSKRIDR